MKKKVLLGIFALAIIATVGFGVRESMRSNVNMSDLTLANVEALANNENLPGKECSFKGSSVYGDYIPCTADYPNIGKCGERKEAFYSADKGQCYE